MIVDAPQPRALKVARKASVMASLRGRGRFSGRPVVGDVPIVVSFTSYGPRIAGSALAIESIARSGRLPQRFILWISDEDFDLDDHPALRRLQARGLEIRQCADYGPYKKSYPYASQFAGDGLPMLTCDDDVLYPAGWFAALAEAHQQHPHELVGLRGHTIGLDEAGFTPYAGWQAAAADQATMRTLLTGVGGIVYPVELLAVLRERGTAFMQECPRADDLWVHHTALRLGMASRRIGTPLTALGIPGSQDNALHHENASGGRNDSLLRGLYTPADLDVLRAS